MSRDSLSLTSIVEEGGTEGGSGLLDQVKLTHGRWGDGCGLFLML